MTIAQALKAADLIELISPSARVATYHGPRTRAHLRHELQQDRAFARLVKANAGYILYASDL